MKLKANNLRVQSISLLSLTRFTQLSQLRDSFSRRANNARILLSKSIAIRRADRVVVAVAIILSGIRGIAAIPSLGVIVAISAKRAVVLADDVCNEEVAGVVRSIIAWVIVVVLGRRLASSSTLAGVVWACV